MRSSSCKIWLEGVNDIVDVFEANGSCILLQNRMGAAAL